MAPNFVSVTVATDDGLGPEIMAACLHPMEEAGARIETETIEIGGKVPLRGISAGIEPSAWESLPLSSPSSHAGPVPYDQIVEGQKGFVDSQGE